MNNFLGEVFSESRVRTLLQEAETRLLATELGIEEPSRAKVSANQLRVSSSSAQVAFLAELDLPVWSRDREYRSEIEARALPVFIQSHSFVEASLASGSLASTESLLCLSALALLARRPHEIRHTLQRREVDAQLQERVGNDNADWLESVRASLTIGVLNLVRQRSHGDLSKTTTIIHDLVAIQSGKESHWLSTKVNSTRAAMQLMGAYYLSQAASRSAEFLLTGSVYSRKRQLADFGAELRRLLTRAEECFVGADDLDLQVWGRSVAACLLVLRESSIWVLAKGISHRLDQLVTQLTSADRSQPVFSLLPSQEDALRMSVLDRARIAIVLQMPTSTGKTLLAEFAIVQTLDAYKGLTRILYLVPTRALATQVRRTLSEDLGPLGINVAAAGSAFEEDPYELNLLSETDSVVVATPEKCDLLIRNHPEWFHDLRLAIVDEAHLLRDSERGARLELLLSTIRREQSQTRLLLLTPFVDNADQIAQWLGGPSGLSISVYWRPSRVLLGLARNDKKAKALSISWHDPFGTRDAPSATTLTSTQIGKVSGTAIGKVGQLARAFESLGTCLAMFSASPADAEKAALRYVIDRPVLTNSELTPQLRVAIALAKDEYGEKSTLSYCLERGAAFHHSALSGILRYLIEDQVRSERIKFIAATSTLAQGMNFPVSTVLVHSLHKPYGRGSLTPSEFWNMAGRAGRVGLVDKGVIVFASETLAARADEYSHKFSETLLSALLKIVALINPQGDIKSQYRDIPELRAFIQYLAHAAATSSPAEALANLEELIEQSLLSFQVSHSSDLRTLRLLAHRYLQDVGKSPQLLHAADTSGLGTFSFNELFAKHRGDPVLSAGPTAVLNGGQTGLQHLVDALKWMPELDLAIGYGTGAMDSRAVAEVVNEWIQGRPVHEIAEHFPGASEERRVREAGRYVNSTVSQTISWGAHAYLKTWLVGHDASRDLDNNGAMLASYIQYGVRTPEAAVACLLNVPRRLSEGFGARFRDEHGPLFPADARHFKGFVETADVSVWSEAITRSGIQGASGEDFLTVYAQMQGLRNEDRGQKAEAPSF